MTNSVQIEELKKVAALDEANRLLELRIIELKVMHGIVSLERQLAKGQALALETRNALLEQERAYIAEHGKAGASAYTNIRASNHWSYDDDKMLAELVKKGENKLIRTKVTQALDKNALKKWLAMQSGDEISALGATWVEEYTVEFNPLGDLVIPEVAE